MFVPLLHPFLLPSNKSIVLTDLFPLGKSFLATRSETCYPNFNELPTPTPNELPDLKWKNKKKPTGKKEQKWKVGMLTSSFSDTESNTVSDPTFTPTLCRPVTGYFSRHQNP